MKLNIPRIVTGFVFSLGGLALLFVIAVIVGLVVGAAWLLGAFGS